jgi:hypothetical protein
MLIGVGLPLIFIPIIMASYDGIPPDKTDQASALMNVARNVARGPLTAPAVTLRLTPARNQTTLSAEVVHEDVRRRCRVALFGGRLLGLEHIALE